MQTSIQTTQLKQYIKNYIQDFYINLESKGSGNTVSQYKGNIDEFIQRRFGYDTEYLTKEDANLIDIDYIIGYFNELYTTKEEDGTKKYKNSTINNKLSSVKTFLKYLAFRKVITIDTNDLDHLTTYKTNSKSHVTMPMNDVFAMINDISKNEPHYTEQKVWFIKLAVETGLRATDILRLTKGQFTVSHNGQKVLIRSTEDNKGKGNKDWKETIDIEFYNELAEVLFKDDTENLFTVSQSTVNKMMDRSQERLGMGKKYSPHSLKRTAVNNTRTFTNDLKAAQVKGKHTSGSTTEIYLDEVEYGATGYFSVQHRTDSNLMNEVEHEVLLDALDELDDSTKLLINMKIQEMLNKNKK